MTGDSEMMGQRGNDLTMVLKTSSSTALATKKILRTIVYVVSIACSVRTGNAETRQNLVSRGKEVCTAMAMSPVMRSLKKLERQGQQSCCTELCT